MVSLRIIPLFVRRPSLFVRVECQTHTALLSTIEVEDNGGCESSPMINEITKDRNRPLLYVTKHTTSRLGCTTFVYEGVDYGIRPTAVRFLFIISSPCLSLYVEEPEPRVCYPDCLIGLYPLLMLFDLTLDVCACNTRVQVYNISDLTAPSLMGYFKIDEWVGLTWLHMAFSADSSTVALYMQADGIVFYDFSDPLSPILLSETIKVSNMSETGVNTAAFTLGYLSVEEAAPGLWYAVASADGVTSTIETLTLSSDEEAPAPETD